MPFPRGLVGGWGETDASSLLGETGRVIGTPSRRSNMEELSARGGVGGRGGPGGGKSGHQVTPAVIASCVPGCSGPLACYLWHSFNLRSEKQA